MNQYKLALFVLLLFAASPFRADAVVKLPRLVSNGMVLQRDMPLKIWGWADPSEKVKVEFVGETYQIKD
jgi:sialate O-acetylesterase